MKISLLLPAQPSQRWQLARQIGVKTAITKLAPELTGQLPPWDLHTLWQYQQKFAQAGFELYGLEGDQFNMRRIKLGLDGRDEDIAKYQQMLRNMGKLGIKLLCYNFMAEIGWYRSHVSLEERGGALTSGFRYQDVQNAPPTATGEVSEARMWDNLRYFLDRIIPVAEEAGVQLALHPDDPPVSPFFGIGRILTSTEAFRRVLSWSDSPSHGITFCQGSFKTMGEDNASLAEEFAPRIFFVHFRDVVGDKQDFRETFQDNGPTDMAAMLRIYQKIGFTSAIRPDHVPSMAGEDNSTPGYAMLGRLFAVGYMRGLMEATNIEIE